MSPLWTAQVRLSRERAAEMIATQHPELAPVHLEVEGEGWDNWAFRVNSTWVFRFPRRPVGAETLERELKWLPYLAPQLPQPVPLPERIGRATPDYPYVWAGYRRLSGTTACRAVLTDPQRTALMKPLGSFLRALHDLPVPDDAPAPWTSRTEAAPLFALMRERLEATARLEPDLSLPDLNKALHSWKTLPPFVGESRWCHGDLYARHLLVNDAGALCGVIDWGDVCCGDPARDLMAPIAMASPEALPVFEEAYGPVDESTWERARLAAMHVGLALVVYGHDVKDPALVAAGRRSIYGSLAR